MTSYSLSELTNIIQEKIRSNLNQVIWVRAEISELRENQNGHCYLELIEKEEDSISIKAKIKAIIWVSTYRMLKPYFETSTGQSLQSGLNVLVAVSVDFHDIYGLSLNICDIDPTFTIGQVAAQRMKIIHQLEEEGIVEMNKQLKLSLIPQRLAIISSPTAAGYEDFYNQLNNNRNAYVFYTHLFPAIVQGKQAESSIIKALEKIYTYLEYFDAVVILRGGGATTDLSCFDSYELALNCAQFPLPIIVGIGHQRDMSILDIIAHTSVKTPTAAAELFVSLLSDAENNAVGLFSAIYQISKEVIKDNSYSISKLNHRLEHRIRNYTADKKTTISEIHNQFRHRISTIFLKQNSKLQLIEQTIESYSPQFLLKHGYTITTMNGKKILSIKDIKPTDKVKTYLSDGDFESEVVSLTKG